jgi:dienelactone hydrolase
MDLTFLTQPPEGYDGNAIELPPLEIGPELPDWGAQAETLRAKWMDFLGHGPDIVPAEVELHAGEDLGDVTRTLISYDVEQGDRVEAYVLAPKGDGPFPGIVVFHPTTNMTIRQSVGFGERPTLQFGLNLAKHGYVTLSPCNYLWDYCGKKADDWDEFGENAAQVKRRWPEWSGMGKMLWDGLRAADVLAEMPMVDESRLGCIGHSLGAKEVLYAMAFDERMKAGISCEGGVGKSFTNWDAPWYLDKVFNEREDLDHHQLLALAAPRAVMVIGGGAGPPNLPEGRTPGADGPLTWNYMEAARPAYALHDAADRLGYLLHNQGHFLPPEDEHLVYDWFSTYI